MTKTRLLLAALLLSLVYVLARQAKISADQQNIMEAHPWVFNGLDPNKKTTTTVILDYDFENVDRCILQATVVRRGENRVLRVKCLKFP